MPPRCLTCSHPWRTEIDAAIINGESLRNIAQRFGGPSPWSIYRHTKHAQATLLAGITARDAALGERLHAELKEMLSCELDKAQGHLHTLITAFGRKPALSKAEWRDTIDGTMGIYVRVIGYLLRLLRQGADSRGPNSRIELIPGVSEFPEGGFPTLRRSSGGTGRPLIRESR